MEQGKSKKPQFPWCRDSTRLLLQHIGLKQFHVAPHGQSTKILSEVVEALNEERAIRGDFEPFRSRMADL